MEQRVVEIAEERGHSFTEEQLGTIAVESAQRLGYVTLKDEQLEAIVTFVQGNDCFIALPTGYGKSAIYGVLPYVFDIMKGMFTLLQDNYISVLVIFLGTTGSIVVCVSPLTSLMLDQQSNFVPHGLQAEFVGEMQVDSSCKEKVIKGQVQLVFITPENLIENRQYRKMLLSDIYQEKLVAIVVDEAHCVKTWGDQFRLAFSRIGDILSLIPSHVNIMALTVTATRDTLHSVVQRLSLKVPAVIAISPYRNNISYELMDKTTIDEFTTGVCEELKSKGIGFPKTVVFVRTYKDCSCIYAMLKQKLGQYFTDPPGYPHLSPFRLVDMYTRVLTLEKKTEVLESFSKVNGKIRLVVATTAYGMGVDCPDIRRIIHWGSPSTIEEYVQETGRAGRDQASAVAILYNTKSNRDLTGPMKQYIANNSTCRSKLLFQHFLKYSNSTVTSQGCKCCDLCKMSCKCNDCS